MPNITLNQSLNLIKDNANLVNTNNLSKHNENKFLDNCYGLEFIEKEIYNTLETLRIMKSSNMTFSKTTIHKHIRNFFLATAEQCNKLNSDTIISNFKLKTTLIKMINIIKSHVNNLSYVDAHKLHTLEDYIKIFNDCILKYMKEKKKFIIYLDDKETVKSILGPSLNVNIKIFEILLLEYGSAKNYYSNVIDMMTGLIAILSDLSKIKTKNIARKLERLKQISQGLRLYMEPHERKLRTSAKVRKAEDEVLKISDFTTIDHLKRLVRKILMSTGTIKELLEKPQLQFSYSIEQYIEVITIIINDIHEDLKQVLLNYIKN